MACKILWLKRLPLSVTAMTMVFALAQVFDSVQAQNSQPDDASQKNISRQQLPSVDSNAGDISPSDNQRLFELRVQSIQQRIEVLKLELSRRQPGEANDENVAKAEANEAGEPEESNTPPMDTSDSKVDGTLPSTAPNSQLGRSGGENKAVGPNGFQLVSLPANSLELGNSLFSIGNFSQALRSYENLLQDEKNPVDRAWIKSFAANCYRLQGNVTTAEKLYREVAGARMNVFAADQAQWYLDFTGRRKQMIADLKAIDEELKPLAEKRDSANGK